ncbi:MAG: hypothetical protein AB1489_30015 [Acidobacteriota bacterium]
MKSLDDLRQQRDQVLLAELAGLLHNIGKLDPNFLASVMRPNSTKDTKEDSDDQQTAQNSAIQDIKQHLQLIPDYSFKRFAGPSFSILTEEVRKVIEPQLWETRKDLVIAIKNQFTDPIEQTVLDQFANNWTRAEKDHPWIAKLLETLWTFHSWSNISNGPLYVCNEKERQKIYQELDATQKEFYQVVDQLKTAPVEQRKELGLLKQVLDSKRKEKLKEWEVAIKKIYQSERLIQIQKEETFRTKLSIANETWRLADLLTLFWDNPFFFNPSEESNNWQSALKRWLPSEVDTGLLGLLLLSHARVSIAEKTGDTGYPKWSEIRTATAFGYELETLDKWKLQENRHRLLDLTMTACSPLSDLPNKRKSLFNESQSILQSGLADTKWPFNEITLWDYASTIATLFKSAVAKAIIEEKVPHVTKVEWRLLSIRYDGLAYLSHALHISDLLARRDTLEAALNATKAIIEVEYPIGNEVYRDENGSVLIVPEVRNAESEIDLMTLPCNDEGTFEKLLVKTFSEAQLVKDSTRLENKEKRPALDGELYPLIAISDKLLGNQIQLHQAKGWNNPPLQSDPSRVIEWWNDQKQYSDICTVCGLRPQGWVPIADEGYKENWSKWNKHWENKHLNTSTLSEEERNKCDICKAQNRSICWICMERRDDRSQKWAQTAISNFPQTIWVDEVSDNNGQIGLIVGRFVLNGWLDGSLIPTMHKRVSFARIQRCWRTTEIFWKQIENELPKTVGTVHSENAQPAFRPRLTITPQNLLDTANLGRYHTYELDIAGNRLSVVWDPANQYFITCENLDYFCNIAAIKNIVELKDKVTKTHSINIYEPASYLLSQKKLAKFNVTPNGVKLHGETESNCSSPFIPILASPSIFMTLVPADKSLLVIKKIKEKYEIEMGKVRDRLPLHTGIVFAHHRTPMRALLEAGRRLLEMPDNKWEQWEISETRFFSPSKTPLSRESSFQDNPHLGTHWKIIFKNQIAWDIPVFMGDSKTKDQWYPYMFADNNSHPDARKNLESWWENPDRHKIPIPETIHIEELKAGNKVFVYPSRFDFEYLDVAARRNEISYTIDTQTNVCHRRERPARPFQLEDFDRLEELWKWMTVDKKKLTTSQLQQLETLLTGYITEWFNGDLIRASQSQTFKEFAQNILRRLNPAWWKSLDEEKQNAFNEAVGNGLLLDVLELYIHILKEKSEEEITLNPQGDIQ